MFDGLLPQVSFSSFGSKGSDKTTNIFVGSAESILDRVLRNELIVILSAEVVLKKNIINDHIAEEYFVRA